MSYCIVAFHYANAKEDVAVVHRKWLAGEKCSWPNFWKSRTLLNAALKNGTEPDPKSWNLYMVHVVINRFYDTFDEARRYLRTAESGSEFSSGKDFTKSKRRRKAARDSVEASESSSEEDLPFRKPTPKKMKVPQKGLPSPPLPPILSPTSSGLTLSREQPSLVAVTYDEESQVGGIGPQYQTLFVEPEETHHLRNAIVMDTTNVEQGEGSQLNSHMNSGSGSHLNQNYSSPFMPVVYGDSIENGLPSPSNQATLSTGRMDGVASTEQGSSPCVQSNTVYNITPQSRPRYTFVSAAATHSQTLCNSQLPSLSADIKCLIAAVNGLQNGQVLLTAKVDNLAEMTRTLLQGKGTRSAAPRPTSDIILPLDSLEAFDILDVKIRSDMQEKEALILNLAARGGNSANNITHRVMATLMTNSLMQEFTFGGQSGKRCFKETMYLQCVCDAVRRNRKGSIATDMEIEKAAEYWLKRASERINRKCKAKGSKSTDRLPDEDSEDSN